MRVQKYKLLTCRRPVRSKAWAMVALIAMLSTTVGRFAPRVQAQVAPVGQGFTVDAGDLRFIYQQILVAQDHAAGGQLLGPGPNQVSDPQLPRGLRTVDGTFNNLVPTPDQHLFGSADRVFPRLTTPIFRDAAPFDPDGPGGQPAVATSYKQKSGIVADPDPRVISNLIVDQSPNNPAAVVAWTNPCGSGGFVCGGGGETDPDTGALFIPNITPDFGLSAPFNLMFAFFGQFFDHGLDLVTKGGGTVIVPLQADDPLFVPGSQTNFMVMTRGQNQPGPDNVLGTADDIQESMNTTTPWVDQNQTYTSHPSHQVFLRAYTLVGGRPVPSGEVLDGGHCSPRGTGFAGDNICNIGNWAEVKAQAATVLGIRLTDQDVFDVPLILTDPYGHFKPGVRGFPQLVLPGNVLLEGNPAANNGAGISVPANAFRSGHAFLNDIAHNAAPNPGLTPDPDTTVTDFRTGVQAPGTYDNELLDAHFVTGDGRGNENIALTMVHQLLHAEHNRLVHYIDNVINTQLTAAEQAQWRAVHAGSGWGYGERLFQAARFVTEMEYQHLVFEEFARKMQPLINPFLGGLTSIDPAISAEFAHTVYRLGHSMLPERIARINANGTDNGLRLFTAFLNPLEYNNGGAAGPLTAAQAAGSLIRGLSREVGNELDEFVTSSVRNTLVGLPLDLAAINIARGRSEGIPPLNEVRRQFYLATQDPTVQPYVNWFDFGLSLRHRESLVNFVAAYGTDPTITAATTVAAKRAAATTLVNANGTFMFAPAATSGLNNIDFWVGGLAEKPSVFGGLLGSTFNYVFEKQLEDLQDGDRFYYLQRTDGLNLRFSLEGNSLAELARRNTDAGATMDNIFNTADFNFDAAELTGTAPINLGDGIQILTLPDGTKLFFDPLHTGKNITFNGGAGVDRFQGDVGDDSLFGNGGADRISGGEGNDTINGGDGDDILQGGNGDDVMKGGPGNDAMNTGGGFGADLAIGGDGNDFMVGGNDGVEYFGAAGNDIVIDGTMRSEGIFGGTGDDWLFDGDGHDGGLFGDGGNVFDLLAGLDPVGGDDVLGGGPGQDNHFGEGGDDIMLISEGSNKFFGDHGFDWVTQRAWNQPGNIELDLLANPGVILNFNDTRNFYRFVDGASGWNFNDRIRGDRNVNDPAAPLERQLQPTMALTAAAAAKITGLTAEMAAFNQPLPFIGGNILLGGAGRDTFEGLEGNDLIDGDRWLDVQLRATMNNGTVVRVNDPRDLIDDVFADPQRLNPGNIATERTIRTGAAAVDTALFSGASTEYTITQAGNATIVTHSTPAGVVNDGTDTLLNVEVLQFTDTRVIVPGANVRIVPPVAGLTQTQATNAITGAGLTLGTVTQAFSNTVPAGRVISSDPAADSVELPNAPVNIVVSLGVNDVTAPTVTITSPANGATVAGTVNVTATATDNVGVVGVQFLVDGNLLGAEDTTAPYSAALNTAALPAGTHVIGARARDARGNVGLAPDVTVNVLNDVTPPTVAITAPANGATVSGTVTVSANAADNVGVASVQFRVDGNPIGAPDTTAPYSVAWTTTTVANGSHVLTAVATDLAGNTATSAAITVNVNNAVADVTPPVVNITAPANGATVSGAAVAVTANATDVGGSGVASVQFLLDGANLGAADTTAPYAITWNSTLATNGAHTLSARATDVAGNVATSAAITVTVSNAVSALPAGLVAAFNFDAAGGSNNATSVNQVNAAFNGTVTGAIQVAGQAGFGQAMQFNGTTSLISVADVANSPLDLTTGMTLSAWVNPSVLAAGGGASGWRTVILKERNNNGLSYSLYANDGPVAQPAGYARIGVADRLVGAGPALPLNTWTHIAVVKDGAGMRLYVNGVLRATNAAANAQGAITTSNNPLRIGGNNVFSNEFFAGMIDDVRIYNRALTAAEINTDRTTRN